jgi:hypothetical protein
MKKFLALYTGSAAALQAWRDMDEATKKEKEAAAMQAWGAWVAEHKDSIVDQGTPLGKTKRIDTHGISDTRNEIGAYTIVQAESHEAAAALFLNHPHFTLFPGDAVEIMECLSMGSN